MQPNKNSETAFDEKDGFPDSFSSELRRLGINGYIRGPFSVQL